MADTIEVECRSSEVPLESGEHGLQFLPAKIKFSGEAEVENYFTKFIEAGNDEGRLNCVFRGRPLNGRVVEVPENYTALVVKGGGKKTLSSEQAAAVKMRAVNRFDRMTVWNYDKPDALKDDNPISKAMQWIDVSEALAAADQDSDEDEEKENSSSEAEVESGDPGSKKRKRTQS